MWSGALLSAATKAASARRALSLSPAAAVACAKVTAAASAVAPPARSAAVSAARVSPGRGAGPGLDQVQLLVQPSRNGPSGSGPGDDARGGLGVTVGQGRARRD